MRITNRLQTICQTLASFTYPRDLLLIVHIFARRRYDTCPENVWRAVDSVGGFLRPREAGLIYWAATQGQIAGPVIELGSYTGRSTIVFALGGRFVHAIDAWSLNVADLSAFDGGKISSADVLENFKNNVRRARVEALVEIHRGLTSQVAQAWKLPGAILFIDAGHTYQDARRDLQLWTRFLLPGGLLLMHDVITQEFSGVTRAASELLQQGWRVVASADSLVAFTRK